MILHFQLGDYMKKIILFTLLAILLVSGCSGKEDKIPVTVLMYHHFAEGEATSVTVDPELFREQLQALKDAGFTSISEKDLLLHFTEGLELPEKPLVITIDDGYVSNYDIAYPILEEMEMYATIYVVTSFRGETPGFIPHFTWEQGREMYESGWIDIQSHTHDLHFYAETARGDKPALVEKILVDGVEETDEAYRERVYNDLKTSKDLIEEHIGNEVFSLTYPYGAYNDTVIEIATGIGFQLMYTVREGVTFYEDNPHAINRINADGNDSGEDLVKKIMKYH